MMQPLAASEFKLTVLVAGSGFRSCDWVWTTNLESYPRCCNQYVTSCSGIYRMHVCYVYFLPAADTSNQRVSWNEYPVHGWLPCYNRSTKTAWAVCNCIQHQATLRVQSQKSLVHTSRVHGFGECAHVSSKTTQNPPM